MGFTNRKPKTIVGNVMHYSKIADNFTCCKAKSRILY